MRISVPSPPVLGHMVYACAKSAIAGIFALAHRGKTAVCDSAFLRLSAEKYLGQSEETDCRVRTRTLTAHLSFSLLVTFIPSFPFFARNPNRSRTCYGGDTLHSLRSPSSSGVSPLDRDRARCDRASERASESGREVDSIARNNGERQLQWAKSVLG